ncbi:SAM-dependent methyltransferase [Methylobacter sp. YRD-M1]|uniref:spermine/spermidine synthase domain-containing protein n=1 Tax=Methylobacter sp. YRD-M1 TaxID=2911520 RepID=UPI00227CD52C|nr:SAM-dependent methyltransferase [Methylobacter sp. YRD-M1]WAK01171.1 SAM-dependent methyltransferase [Methylobacter sp. YRD-M1]
MTEAKPSRSYLLAIAVISASALAYEVLLMRLFSIIQWHHFAYMIISLALLGYGVSGVFLALNRDALQRRFPAAITANMLLFSFSAPVCFALAQMIPFNPEEILWAPVQLLYLLLLYLLLALPFFFAANVIGLSFYHYQGRVSLLYGADLLGAGLGSIGIILLLFLLFPEKILTVLTGLGIAAAVIVSHYSFRDQPGETRFRFNAGIIIGLAVTFAMTGWLRLNVSPYKGESQMLRVPGTKVIDRYSSPLGLIDVVKSAVTPLRHAPGLSLNATAEPPEQLAVFTDADNMIAIDRYDGNPEALSYLDQTTSALPYHLRLLQNVLILGAGTGSDILQAHYHAIDRIDAVELNPQVIDLVEKKYADFAGHIYQNPHVNLHIGEARGFVATSDEHYDLINISLLDAFGASAAGLYALSENYLYTEQAIQADLRHLSPGGYLSITRWIKMPPRDTLKLLATVVNACKTLKIKDPEQRIVLIRSWQTSTLLVKNGPFSDQEIDNLKQFSNERSFDLAYYPGIRAEEVNRFNILEQPYFYLAAKALLGADGKNFMDNYKFNIEPATDDRPYFFHFFKWKTLPEIVPLLGQGGISLLESGYLLLVAALLQAVLASLVLIALPLVLGRNRLGMTSGTLGYRQVVVYFVCLGLAFFFIEIAFIQKFILILHHPIYAVTAVLCTFLISAGGGSLFSKRLGDHKAKSMVRWPVAGIALFSAVYIFGFEALTNTLLELSGSSRLVFSILLIAPLGFFMGMPFPMGMDSLGRTAPTLIPWAWGINGCASVISAILATLIAMQLGFSALVFMALLLYVVAAFNFP